MSDRVRISDFSDRELLALVADLGSQVTARDLAIRIFGIAELEENEQEIRRESRCVTSRLSWMRRFGLIERDKESGEWLISAMGEALRKTRVSRAIANGIESADEAASLSLANIVGERLVSSGPVAGQAMQRELQFQITRRRARWR